MLTVILSSIIALWNICPKGETVSIESHLTADLVVISDCDSPNMAPAYNVSATTLVASRNRETAFVQTPDGKFGLRLIFERGGENMLHRGDHVKMDFFGCSISRDTSSDALTVKGVTAQGNILAHRSGVGVTPKARRLSELTMRDINTYVTVTDVDVVFKDGSWYNVQEAWTRKMDGWASLLRADDGRCIYMLLTNACGWRRTGAALPQGAITVSGVLVNEINRRYGPQMGPFCIRPVFEDDIVEVSDKSVWKTFFGWEKQPETGKKLDFEASGNVEIGKKGIRNDRILNDIGSGKALLWTDSNSEIIVHSGYNSVSKEKDGLVADGAIMFGGKTVDWYEWDNDKVVGSKAFYVRFNASKMTKGLCQFSFEWAAGSKDGNKCWYYPVEWVVECKAEGTGWVTLTDAATCSEIVHLHNLPWSDAVIKDSGHQAKMKAGYDTAMGEQQHSFVIPQQILAEASDVTIRIRPATTCVARIRSNPEKSYSTAQVNRSASSRSTWIRFDNILVDYKK